MNLRHYLRGLGIGMIVTAVILSISFSGKSQALTDDEIRERAMELGMVEKNEVLLSEAEKLAEDAATNARSTRTDSANAVKDSTEGSDAKPTEEGAAGSGVNYGADEELMTEPSQGDMEGSGEGTGSQNSDTSGDTGASDSSKGSDEASSSKSKVDAESSDSKGDSDKSKAEADKASSDETEETGTPDILTVTDDSKSGKASSATDDSKSGKAGSTTDDSKTGKAGSTADDSKTGKAGSTTDDSKSGKIGTASNDSDTGKSSGSGSSGSSASSTDSSSSSGSSKTGNSDSSDSEDAVSTAGSSTSSGSSGARKAGTITIRSGADSLTVANDLESKGVIDSAAAFDSFLCSKGYDRRLTTGTFSIPAGATDEEIARIIMGY
ncbi:MAG: hypothetical protein K5989_06050 [Lachnospiraceae bacterium]|nr:hypothetical protein [Lachnospiraceae bacterium]